MDEDEGVNLSPETLRALNEFLKEKNEREQLESIEIQSQIGKDVQFEENWQLSQFWYNKKTKVTLGSVVKQLIGEETPSTLGNFRIALLSCPSLYKTVKDIHDNVNLFEYDTRFRSVGPDFVYYDYNESNDNYLKLFHQQYKLIIADPPFLSQECITKTCGIIKNLLKKDMGKIIICSGVSVEKWLDNTGLDVKKCLYQPKHERNLCNEFVSYANFNLDKYIV